MAPLELIRQTSKPSSSAMGRAKVWRRPVTRQTCTPRWWARRREARFAAGVLNFESSRVPSISMASSRIEGFTASDSNIACRGELHDIVRQIHGLPAGWHIPVRTDSAGGLSHSFHAPPAGRLLAVDHYYWWRHRFAGLHRGGDDPRSHLLPALVSLSQPPQPHP